VASFVEASRCPLVNARGFLPYVGRQSGNIKRGAGPEVFTPSQCRDVWRALAGQTPTEARPNIVWILGPVTAPIENECKAPSFAEWREDFDRPGSRTAQPHLMKLASGGRPGPCRRVSGRRLVDFNMLAGMAHVARVQGRYDQTRRPITSRRRPITSRSSTAKPIYDRSIRLVQRD